MAITRIFLAVCVLILISKCYGACDFSKSCQSIRASGTTLSANCKKSNGQLVGTSIDVNNCVGNKNGGLSCKSSGFAKSCTNIQYRGTTLTASCRKTNGDFVTANQNLDNCIRNIEGQLQCC